MSKSFDLILDSLLKEYMENPHGNINEMVKKYSEENGLKCNAEAIEEANLLLDTINGHYNDLVKMKEEDGISTTAWFKKTLSKIIDKSDVKIADKEKFIDTMYDVVNE